MGLLDKTLYEAFEHMAEMNAALQRITLEGDDEGGQDAVLVLCKGKEAEEVNEAIDRLEEKWHS